MEYRYLCKNILLYNLNPWNNGIKSVAAQNQKKIVVTVEVSNNSPEDILTMEFIGSMFEYILYFTQESVMIS